MPNANPSRMVRRRPAAESGSAARPSGRIGCVSRPRFIPPPTIPATLLIRGRRMTRSSAPPLGRLPHVVHRVDEPGDLPPLARHPSRKPVLRARLWIPARRMSSRFGRREAHTCVAGGVEPAPGPLARAGTLPLWWALMTRDATRTLQTPDGPMDVYEALPEEKATGAVIVIQEAFGVNDYIRDVTRRVAAA